MGTNNTGRTPNDRLRHIREDELNMSRSEFAAAMADAARELKENASCTVRQVARLEDGEVRYPQPPYRRILAVVCGRPFAQLGFPRRERPPRNDSTSGCRLAVPQVSEGSNGGQAEPTDHRSDVDLVRLGGIADTLRAAADVGRGDVRRREMVVGAPFVVGALAAPSRDWLLASLENDGPADTARAGMAQVTAIRDMFRVFQELDVIQGGGEQARRAVALYLTEHVLPLLDQHHPEPVRLALYEVASEQTYLAGWMAYDSGRHGLAQRYLIQSLRLAQASGNRALGSHVLAGMSDQATHVGHPQEGLRLAQAGRHGLTGVTAPAALTDLYVLEARALAAMRRPTECTALLMHAERAYDQIRPGGEAEWARFIDEAYVTGEIANSLRDLGDGAQAERYARTSVAAATRQARGRRRALSQAALAAGHAQQNEIEAAAQAGREALNLVGQVPASSASRCVAALDDLRLRLTPYAATPAVRDLFGRLNESPLFRTMNV